MRIVAVVPINGKVVVDSEERRRELYAKISGLCHIVEASIIHNGRCCAVFPRESSIAQRVNSKGSRSSHVVLETECMSYFMCYCIGETLLEDVGGKCVSANGLVYIRCLHEAPFVEQIFNIIVNNDRSIDDFSCGRVYPRGTHSILLGVRDIADARIGQIVRVELRIFLGCWKISYLYGVSESDSFKGCVPAQNSLSDRSAPSDRKSGIDIENNGLDWLDEVAGCVVDCALGD